MRVLTSFSLLGGTAQCAHNTRASYAATVKPGRISRRRNLNSWKRETGYECGGNQGIRGKREKERENGSGSLSRWLYEDNADKS